MPRLGRFFEVPISTNIERPLRLRWTNSSMSQEAMGGRFDRVVAILRRAELHDAQNGCAEKFELHLE
ncbi:ribonuclease inhibitor barstar [Massilia sp. CCM 8694]|uniref:Ribonuclease inhibitor barstar n=2 Tax=Massilia genomosp. 1 TaxID=2609280 RepID=A0ABX0MTZ9_9BURK|nr:ribonuclease inhibitor barstar [Massilia genomosp. 1]